MNSRQVPSNTFISIISISIIFLICGGILRYITLLDGDPKGSEHIIFYFFFILIFLYIGVFALDLTHIKYKIFIVFIFWKIPLAMIFLDRILTRYGTGDLGSYYFTPAIMSRFNLSWDALQYLWHYPSLVGDVLITYLDFQFFRIMPISLYGLAFIYALISYLSYLMIYKIFREYIELKNILFILLFLLPSIAMQSSYIGKEGIMLSSVCMMFFIIDKYSLSNNKEERFWLLIILLIIVFLIYKIRVYQFLIIMCALIATLFYRTRGKIRVLMLAISVGISYYAISYIKTSVAVKKGMHEFTLRAIKEGVEMYYQGGSLMLKPYPFPFQLLQIFRPFLWESNNLFALLNSIELTVLMILYVVYLRKNYSLIKTRISTIPVYTFLAFYVFLSTFAFSFDPNMGDMTRRRSYVIPFLSVLLLK